MSLYPKFVCQIWRHYVPTKHFITPNISPVLKNILKVEQKITQAYSCKDPLEWGLYIRLSPPSLSSYCRINWKNPSSIFTRAWSACPIYIVRVVAINNILNLYILFFIFSSYIYFLPLYNPPPPRPLFHSSWYFIFHLNNNLVTRIEQ